MTFFTKHRNVLFFSVVGLVAGMAFNMIFGAPPWELGGLLGGVSSGVLLFAGS